MSVYSDNLLVYNHPYSTGYIWGCVLGGPVNGGRGLVGPVGTGEVTGARWDVLGTENGRNAQSLLV